MRTLALLMIPSLAFAYDSDVQNIELEANQELFRGEEVSAFFPAPDSTVAIKFGADTATDLQLAMAAQSQLTWPETMGHTISSLVGGGEATFITTTTLSAAIRVNLFDQVVDVDIWSQAFEWTSTNWFDSLLLPEGTGSTALGLTLDSDSHYFYETLDWNVSEDIVIAFGIRGTPVSTAIVTGDHMTFNGVDVAHEDLANLPMTANRGSYEVNATWYGHITSSQAVELVPFVEVTWDDFSFPLEFYNYTFDLGNDDRDITSKVTTFEHAIPTIDTYTVLDLGDVQVGELTEREFEIGNLGEMTLNGSAIMQGDAAFDVLDRNFSVIADSDTTLTVSFQPTVEGDFQGELILRSNDPMDPELAIPVVGTAVPLPTIDDDPNEGPVGEGQIRGCGCSSSGTGAPGAALGLGLIGLLGLRRRR